MQFIKSILVETGMKRRVFIDFYKFSVTGDYEYKLILVDAEGKITGIDEGSATITATVDKVVKTSVIATAYNVHSNITDQKDAELVEEIKFRKRCRCG